MEFRKTEVFRNGIWESIEFSDIKNGEKFRLFDDEDPVSHNGKAEFIAHSEPFIDSHNDNIWSIEAE